jgi:lipid A 3-O-deacylase
MNKNHCMLQRLSIFFLLLLPAFVSANPDSLLPDAYRGYFRLEYENDLFDQNDWYYTQGIKAELVAPFAAASPVRRILLRAGKNSTELSGFLFQTKGFTPYGTDIREIQYGNRPYAGNLWIGQVRLSASERWSVRSEIHAGIMGPAAQGKEIHVGIHRALKNRLPEGWDNQVHNDIILTYAVNAEHLLIGKKYFQLLANGRAIAGTWQDKAALGIRLRTGFFAPFSDFPFTGKSKKFECWFTAWGEAWGVGYDATLQGGMFNRTSPYTIAASGIERLVWKGGGGFCVRYKRVLLEYSRTWITPEFKGGRDHGWGAVTFSLAF